VKWANIQTFGARVSVNCAGLVAGQMAPDKQVVIYATKVHFLTCQGLQYAQVVELLQDFLLYKDLPLVYQEKLHAVRDIT
jgi:hypothetical protein